MRIAIVFDNFGPYHLSRLRAAEQVGTILGVEMRRRSRDYDWHVTEERDFDSITVDGSSPRRCAIAGGLIPLWKTLRNFYPDCVFLPGWSRVYSLFGLLWCQASKVPAVVMSESTQQDLPRGTCKEWFKKGIVARYSAAFVGGSRHAQYLVRLGMSPDQIFDGYDVVDNGHFLRGTVEVRRHPGVLRNQFNLPQNYFLASARFIEKKNLLRLVEAYASYRRNASTSANLTAKDCAQPWSLVLLGDGPQREQLKRLITTRKLESFVLLPGFKQYWDLPTYYGLAGAFVHISTSEPWGLVINEAMACGLPLIVSERCGCVPELVQEGRNGFIVDPTNVLQIARKMYLVSTLGPKLSRMCTAGQEILSRWGPERFALGLSAAARKAVALCASRRAGRRALMCRL